MDLGAIVRKVGKGSAGGLDTDVVPVIEFIESKTFGLGLELFPIQRVIIKAHYGIALEKVTKTISLRNWRGDDLGQHTEEDYLKWVFDQGRCNISEVEEGNELRELVLSVGRRSGKTLIASCISAYETLKLLRKGDPHRYYGLPESNPIQLISVATDKDQAGLLFAEVSAHFKNCQYFAPYVANSTETYAKFQTPLDQEKFGLYTQNKRARRSIKVTFRPCIAKGLRGAGNIVIILDEVAHFVDSSNMASAEAIYTAVSPSLLAFSPKDPNNKFVPIGSVEGRRVLISSPLGKTGFFYHQFELGMKGTEGMFCFQAPTWEVNPTIPAGEFRKEFARDSRKFYQEYGADFTDNTKGWIEEPQDLYDCIDETLKPISHGIPKMPYFIGIDVAVKDDATAFAIGHVDYKDRRIVTDYVEEMQAGKGKYEFDENGDKLEKLDFRDHIAARIIELTKKFHIVKGMYDQEQGYALESHLKHAGIKNVEMVRMTDTINSEIYANFKSRMYDRQVALYNVKHEEGTEYEPYINQFTQLQCEYKNKYKIKVFAPKRKGAHDDTSDAIARMVWLASEQLNKKNIITNVKSNYMAVASANPLLQKAASRNRHQTYRKRGGSHPSRMPRPASRMSGAVAGRRRHG